MAEVTTTRQVNLDRLTTEMGVSLRMVGTGSTTDEKKIRTDDTDQATLQAAVDAHVYDPAWTPPPTAEQTNATTIRERADAALADLRTIANTSGTLNGAQLSNAARVMAKVLIVLVRLALRRFEALD